VIQSRTSSRADRFPGSSEVQLRAVWLRAPDRVSRAYRAWLSPEEMARADRFAFDHLRQSYQVSQGALRLLLARYMMCDPRELAFTFGPQGKPALRERSRLRFNIGHSGGLALYAFAVDCEIGVDVEEVRGNAELERIAARFFCEAEASALSSIGDERLRREAFFRCWTRKEAYVKAVGGGLSLPLDHFQVSLLPDEPARFVHIGNDAASAAAWNLQHLDPAPNYVGALAYRGRARDTVCQQPVAAQDLLELDGAWPEPGARGET
jgi:4'-phosphopantetheinyl transferase